MDSTVFTLERVRVHDHTIAARTLSPPLDGCTDNGHILESGHLQGVS